MVFDGKAAARIRESLARSRGISEKKMFGGLAFLFKGKMCVGLVKEDLVVRVKPEMYEACLAKPHVRPMDFTGRPMKGFVFVAPKGFEGEKKLRHWVAVGLDCARSLLNKK